MVEEVFGSTGRNLRPRADRSISREPVSQPSRRPKQQKRSGAGNPTVNNPVLPNVDTQKSFAYGSRSTPALPRRLEADPLMGERQMAAALDMGMRRAHGRELETTEQRDGTSPKNQAWSHLVDRQSASVSPSHHSRQTTPDDQLLESLRAASEEVETLSEQASTAFGESSVSWITERAVLRGQSRIVPGPANRRQPRRSPLVPSREPTPESHRSVDTQSQPEDELVADIPGLDATESPAGRIVGTTSAERYSQPTEAPPPVSSPRHAKKTAMASSHGRSSSFNMYSPLTILLMLFAVFGIYTLGGQLKSATQDMHFPFPPFGAWGSSSSGMDTGSAAYQAINRLASEVDRRFSNMANDISALKTEWDRRLLFIERAKPEAEPLPPRRVNFLSPGLGTIIEPYRTSPSITERDTFLQSLRRRLAGVRPAQPPIAALTSWNEVGDCWCAAKHSGYTQLAALLGRPIVPEEVVVEHIPKDETLDHGVAPRQMELWVQYKLQSSTDADSASLNPESDPIPIPSSLSGGQSPPPSVAQPPPPLDADHTGSQSPSSLLSFAQLRDTVLSSLRIVYPDEPETAYSNDPYLGPNFFRVGRWEYDINGSNNIQRFLLDAVIDMPGARVEKVLFRVKSTWGGDNVCLYRLRLHGHL